MTNRTDFEAIVLGLGGILTEALADVAFARAPLSRDEALENCEGRRADRRVKEPCYVYAIGDERLEPDRVD